ncbi:ferrochelatase [Pleionea sediminis]|uniref:ferrochelatase n=1 Tax=Pleionea sediminis TaxID=2569479 RepID=UPI001184A1F7|nr:ferrochelatase [Pleionea sediminis]
MTISNKLGVLLVNLGTPDEPTSAAVRKYLAEFLHDKRVVDLSRWIWCPVLHGIILRVRPPKVAKLYQAIWTDEGAPLLAISKKQTSKLRQFFRENEVNVSVELAMNYGNPSISSGLEKLRDCSRILVLPLYPQFSSATTASVFDRIAKVQAAQWNLPAMDFVRDYHDHPLYIKALAESVRRHWQNNERGDRLLMSFHGIPQRYATNGDPYPNECARTAELLAEELGLSSDEWILCFQSRFGRELWLQPYTDKTMEKLGQQKLSVDVICPGFSADCLETIEEIEQENKEIFQQSGGQRYHYIPCLNDDDQHIVMMAEIIQSRLNIQSTVTAV